MIIIANPVQARAYGRALAWIDDCQLEAAKVFTCGEVPVFRNLITGEERACLLYIAHWQDDHLVDQNGSAFFYDQVKAIPYLRDDRLHTVRATVVDGQRLSRSNQPHQYSYWHNQQIDLGITPRSEVYIHPLDRIPKDHLIALILKGETFEVIGLKDVVQSLKQDELVIRNAAVYNRSNNDRQAVG